MIPDDPIGEFMAYFAIISLALAAVLMHDPQQECFTDSCVFARCEIENGRPCTDDDVFGPPCDELPPDDPEYCQPEEE